MRKIASKKTDKLVTMNEFKGEFNKLLGIISNSFTEMGNKIDSKFAEVDEKFGKIDVKFMEVDRRFESMHSQFMDVNKRIDTLQNTMERGFNRFDKKFDVFKNILSNHGRRIAILEDKI